MRFAHPRCRGPRRCTPEQQLPPRRSALERDASSAVAENREASRHAANGRSALFAASTSPALPYGDMLPAPQRNALVFEAECLDHEPAEPVSLPVDLDPPDPEGLASVIGWCAGR